SEKRARRNGGSPSHPEAPPNHRRSWIMVLRESTWPRFAMCSPTDPDNKATTTTYIQAQLDEVVQALAALTGEPHPLASQGG
ncbi:MAG: hypothetical protein QOE61_198, partial [Micromonosporaceae bacterium]|nr:hypothetical protein [Micromonosporaceae bacterium]